MENTRRIAFGCFGMGFLVLVVAIPILWRHTDIGDAQASFDTNLRDYRSSGLPWTADDLIQNPPVADADNAAIVAWQSMQSRKNPRLVERDLAQAYERATNLSLADARKLTKAYASTLVDARKIAKMPGFDFKHDWDLGANLEFGELGFLKSCAHLLAATAILEAADGNDGQALADLSSMNRLSEHAGKNPSIIGLLSRISILTIRAKAIEVICDQWHGDPKRLERLLAAANERVSPIHFVYYWQAEAYMGLSTMRNIDRQDSIKGFLASNPENPISPKKAPFLVRSGSPKGWRLKILMSRFYQMWAHIAKLEKQIDDPKELGKKMDEYTDSPDTKHLSYLWAAIVFPVYGQAGMSIVRNDANYATIRAMLRIQLFKAKNGKYPSNLAEAGVTDLDPFVKKPLIYRADGQGFKVYSVGQDMMDDGGKRRGEVKGVIKNKAGYDIVASYPAYRKKP